MVEASSSGGGIVMYAHRTTVAALVCFVFIAGALHAEKLLPRGPYPGGSRAAGYVKKYPSAAGRQTVERRGYRTASMPDWLDSRNPYAARTWKLYTEALVQYERLVGLMRLYPYDYRVIMVEYYRYMRLLADYEYVKRRYEDWERKHPAGGEEGRLEKRIVFITTSPSEPWYYQRMGGAQYQGAPGQYRQGKNGHAAGQYPSSAGASYGIRMQSTPAGYKIVKSFGLLKGRHVRKKIRLKPGEAFAFDLESNPSTGYRWNISFIPPSGVASVVTRTMIRTHRIRPGAPVVERFVVKADAEGEVKLVMRYERPWSETVPPSRTVVFVVKVGRGGGKPSGRRIYALENAESRSRVVWEISRRDEPKVARYMHTYVEIEGYFEKTGLYRGRIRKIVRVRPAVHIMQGGGSDGNAPNEGNDAIVPGWNDINVYGE